MNAGIGLQELARELEAQAKSKRDFVAAQGAVRAIVTGSGELALAGVVDGEEMPLTDHAHRQLGDHLGVPARYYERMRAESPALLAQNVQTWLDAAPDNRRMVRTLNGRVRAWLSDRYRPLDNADLAGAVLPTLLKHGAQVVSTAITDARMYVKAILPKLSSELPDGMRWGVGHNAVTPGGAFGRTGRVVAAVVISNSEVGAGALRVEPSMFTTWCTNLAVMTAASMKKYHVGRAFEAEEDFSVYRDETRQADDRAFFMKVQDVVETSFSDGVWQAAVAQLSSAVKDEIKSKDLPKVVEVGLRRLSLPEGLDGAVLTALAAGGDLTRWGLSSAITSVAGDVVDYERSTALERAGGKVLSMPDWEWKMVAEAA